MPNEDRNRPPPRQPSVANDSRSPTARQSNAEPSSKLVDDASLEYLCRLMKEKAAIVLGKDKAYLIHSRLQPLLRESGLASLKDLVQKLQTRSNGSLHDQVVDAMTTNETSFFRDGVPFEMLRAEVLPRLFRTRAAERQLRVWSAACASGQEAYSLAMLLDQHFPAANSWKVHILGTDISQAMVRRATAGTYSELEIVRGLSDDLRDVYFRHLKDGWQINSAIRRRVEFRVLNLDAIWPPMAAWDVIMLRNVLVYFDADAKREVLAKVRQVLRPDGVLILGGAETTLHIDPNFQRRGWGGFSYYELASGQTP